jgi:hypothetical protein
MFSALPNLAPIVGWLGLGGSTTAVLLFLAIAPAFAPLWLQPLIRFLAPLRLWLFVGAGACALATFSFGYGVHYGSALIHERWRAAEDATLKRGEAAREQAENEIPAVAEEPAPPAADGAGVNVLPPARKPVARRLSNDRYERDDR